MNGFSVFVGIDAVNVMAAYQPVVQACGSEWRREHLGASVIIFKLFLHFYDFIIMCSSWNNKKSF